TVELTRIATVLRNFAKFMLPTGDTTKTLLRAADVLEMQEKLFSQFKDLLRAEHAQNQANLELIKTLEGKCAGLEASLTKSKDLLRAEHAQNQANLELIKTLEGKCAGLETSLTKSKDLLRAEHAQNQTNLELIKTLEGKCSGLETQARDLMVSLDQNSLQLDTAIMVAKTERDQLLVRAEQAEAQLLAIRSRDATLEDTHVLFPIATLQQVQAQFESLAREFEKSGDIVSRVMCEASASVLGRAVLVAMAPPSGTSACAL
ncbi:MAG: hypothetical protein Q7T45_27040, partial [Bradyrhizobium sp.]|uniref:hypothetical protein n=1 Tax=Bradyrhizobium sp. TaxID=376 RepID=UPI00271DA590